MEIYELAGKELKIIVLKKISKLKKNADRQLSETRKTFHEQNEQFNKDKS